MSLCQEADSQRADSAGGPEKEAGGDGGLGQEGTSQAHVDDDHQSAVFVAAAAAVAVVDEVVNILVAEEKIEEGGPGAARTSTERR